MRSLLGHGVVVVASFNSTFVEWFPAAPRHDWISGVALTSTGLTGFAFRCCGSLRHALTGKVGSGSRVPSFSWLPPVGPIRDFHPPPFIHARRTQSPYGLLPIPPRSLSLPTYSCVDPPPPSTLISRGEVSHRCWHRGQQAKAKRDPVAPAKRSEAAMRKIQTKKLDDGSPASSFRTLLRLLSNIVRNKCRTPGAASSDMTFDVTTSPDSKQRRAYELLKGITV